MNIKFRTIVLIGLALSVNAQSIDLKNFDIHAEDQKKLLTNKSAVPAQAPKKKLLIQKGHPSHFDPALGKQTFIWAPENRGVAQAPKQPAANTSSRTQLRTLTKGRSKAKPSDSDMAKAYVMEYFSRHGNTSTPQSKAPARQGRTLAKRSASPSASGEDIYLVSHHASKFGPKVTKFRQKYNGIEVFAREANVLMGKTGDLVAVSGYLADAKPTSQPSVQSRRRGADPAAAAIEQAFANMGIKATLAGPAKGEASKSPYTHYKASTQDDTYNIVGTPRAKKVWYEYQKTLLAAHYVEVGVKERKPQGENFHYSYVIAESPVGKSSSQILFRKNLKQHVAFTYRTFADADANNTPFRGPMKNIYPLVGLSPEQALQEVSLDYDPDSHQLVTLESGPISTQDPWLPEGASETRGNNVFAYADIVPESGFTEGDIVANTSDINVFDWPYDPEAPASLNSRQASVVNLFYMNNWLHDYFYDFGFDEASGNAQADNYGRGGVAGDPLLVEAQDYGGVNNAFMIIPADGASPLMQMFIFQGLHKRGETYDLTAEVDGETITLFSPNLSYEGPEQFDTIEGNLVLIEEVCAEPSNASEVAGNIVLVKRDTGEGTACYPWESVKIAQDAGAKAVVLVGYAGLPTIYNAVESGINVPNMGIHPFEGEKLIEALTQNQAVKVSMYRDYIPNRDGTLANGVVAHEWGHYLTNRLVGDGAGLINPQGRGMGEGWSDFLTTYFAIKEEHRYIPGNENFQGLYSNGSWVVPSAYFGIRRVPYSTDMNYNAVLFENISTETPFEFDHPVAFQTNNAEIHAQGEFWANTLLEVYVSLLNDSDRLSFKEAKERMAYYLVTGLKMTPIFPTYTEARDAMLGAALIVDEDDYDRMLAAFAKRGLGLKAVAADHFSETNIGTVNSFDTEASAFSVVSSRIEVEKSYNDSEVSMYDDPILSSLAFLGNTLFQCPKDGVQDLFEFGEVVVEIANTGTLDLEDLDMRITSDTPYGIYFAHEGYKKIELLVARELGTVEIRVPFIIYGATTAQTFAINVDFEQSKPDIDYPVTEELSVIANYDFAPDEGRLTDTLENTAMALHDWTIQVDQPLPGTDEYIRALNNTFTLNGFWDPVFFTGQMWTGLNNAFATDVSLVSPVVEISQTEAFRFSFEHVHDFEPGNWDGGVIEVSIDGGAWADVTSVGAELLGYGYNGQIGSDFGQLLAGRQGYVNLTPDPVLNATTVDFGTSLAGKTAQFRFRIGTDYIGGRTGWLIDNIGFEGINNSPFSKAVPHELWCNFW